MSQLQCLDEPSRKCHYSRIVKNNIKKCFDATDLFCDFKNWNYDKHKKFRT